MNPNYYLVLAGIIFTIGAFGVLVRRNAIIVPFFKPLGEVALWVVAAAEVVVGLAIIVTIFRTRRSASIDEANLLKF